MPSRIHHGQFYALPQSPQLFKQMLMMAGFDRYYQIVKCFRDEDLRADRQPEFTQIDIETSFLDELEIRALMEGLVRAMFKEALGVELPDPFPVMTYADAMRDYGSDKPDLRVSLKLTELTDLMKTVDFKVFRAAADLAGRTRRRAVRARRRHAVAQGDRRLHDVRQDLRRRRPRLHQGQRRHQGRTRKACNRRSSSSWASRRCARSSSAPAPQNGDLIFFGADREKVVNDALGALRAKVGHERGFAEDGLEAAVGRRLSDVRIRRREEDLGARATIRSPRRRTATRTCSRRIPASALAKAYDVVLNGWEIGGGSVRIHRPEVQAKVFAALGISPEDQQKKFGFLLDALQYGAPPHGGIAFGFDRMVTLMCGVDSIRDVIAFPKTQRGQDLLIDAPTPVTEQQLRDLHIKVRPTDSVKLT